MNDYADWQWPEFLGALHDLGVLSTIPQAVSVMQAPRKWRKEYYVWEVLTKHSPNDLEMWEELMAQASCALCQGPLQYATTFDRVDLVVPGQAISLAHSWCAADHAHDAEVN